MTKLCKVSILNRVPFLRGPALGLILLSNMIGIPIQSIRLCGGSPDTYHELINSMGSAKRLSISVDVESALL